jgi:hypothetical protein
MGAYSPQWPKAAGIRPVAYGPHWPRLPPPASPAPMLRSRVSPGSDARHWSPDVILGFAEYALSFPIYICLSFSLSLLFRQSLLYDSQFNISIRTRLISTAGTLTACRYIIPLFRNRPPGLQTPVQGKERKGKEGNNQTNVLCTYSYDLISPATDQYRTGRPFGGSGARGNSTSSGRW